MGKKTLREKIFYEVCLAVSWTEKRLAIPCPYQLGLRLLSGSQLARGLRGRE